MATLKTLAIDKLMLRGNGNEFNSFGRMFNSLKDANDALASGDYVPAPGQNNAVIVAGEGIMVYSFDINGFVDIKEMKAASNQANRYIDLDGVNDYIEFLSAGDVLDFTNDWSIGVTLVGVTGPISSTKINLFGRGGVQITLQAQEGSMDWGLYVTSDNDLYSTEKRAQANVSYKPKDFSRLLFVYDSKTRRLKYFIGDPSNGIFAQWGNLLIPQSMIDGQNIERGLCIGKGFNGVGGSRFSSINWNGGFNNLILSNIAFTGPYLIEYFQTSEDFTKMELYSDVVAYAKLGEDEFPNVKDEKGLLLGGQLVNGKAGSFKDIPTEQ